jgi:hypothetical protein
MRSRPWLLVPVIAVLPFVLLPWLVPAFSHLTIGQDYVIYSIQNQLELQLSLAHGTWPLFAPGFAGGTSAAALTLGQLYHPLPHIAALFPGYGDGRGLEWNTCLRLLSLGLVQLALYGVLIQWRLRPALACVVSLVTVYNLRMLDLFRYGAGLEAYTAHLLLCASLLWYACTPTRRLGPAAIVVSTYLLAVSGHPQMAYYGLVASGLVWLLAPLIVGEMRPDCSMAQRRLRFYARSAACVVAGLLLASAYTLPFFFEVVRENGSRFAQPYEWSTSLQDSYGGVLRNFVSPFHSDVHTAFGGSFLPLLALLAPLLLTRFKRVPIAVWALTSTAVLVLLIALGSATPVHRVAWALLPLQSTMRVPGRVTLLLPVMTMLLLAWALQEDPQDFEPRARRLGGLSLLVAMVAGVGWLLADRLPPPAAFYPAALHSIPPWAEVTWVLSGALALLALAGSTWLRRFRPLAEAVLVVMIGVQSATALAFGTWTTARQASPSLRELEATKRITLTYPFSFGWGMYPASVEQHLKHTFFAPQLARLYPGATAVRSQEDAYAWLDQQRQPDRAVIEIAETENGSVPTGTSMTTGEVVLDHVTFNRLVLTTKSDATALLALSFPYTDRWRATLNGLAVRLYRVNGNELGVQVPPGTSRVELRYHSRAAFTGIALTLLTAAILLLGLAATVTSAGWRRCAYIAAVLMPALAGLMVARRIYAGESLATQYQWHWMSRESHNVAFGRATRMSSMSNPENMHLLHSSRAVDGQVAGEGAATTANESNPWWQVDLGATRHVAKIIIYEGRRDRRSVIPAYLPLRVGVGDDPKNTPVPFVIEAPSSRGAWLLSLPQPVDGRYVTLASSSQASMSLAEVEVYEAAQPGEANQSQ